MTYATATPVRPIVAKTVASQADRERHREMERLIEWYFPVTEHRMAKWVAWQVSGMEPLARNRHRDHAYGLFQLTPDDLGWERTEGWLLHNPVRSVAAAYRIWRAHGWGFWQVPPLPPSPFTDVLAQGA